MRKFHQLKKSRFQCGSFLPTPATFGGCHWGIRNKRRRGGETRIKEFLSCSAAAKSFSLIYVTSPFGKKVAALLKGKHGKAVFCNPSLHFVSSGDLKKKTFSSFPIKQCISSELFIEDRQAMVADWAMQKCDNKCIFLNILRKQIQENGMRGQKKRLCIPAVRKCDTGGHGC